MIFNLFNPNQKSATSKLATPKLPDRIHRAKSPCKPLNKELKIKEITEKYFKYKIKYLQLKNKLSIMNL